MLFQGEGIGMSEFETVDRWERDMKHEEAVYERDGYKCVYCDYDASVSYEAWLRARLNVDHWIPRSKGGSDEMDNLLTACGPCNSGKGNKLFPTLEAARIWLRIYFEECAKPYYETRVTKTAATYELGGIERTWKRYEEELARADTGAKC
jgi:hypothetical protein